MSYLINNQQKLNDLVFANRNKNYGAYAIRSSYGNTLLKSLSCVIFGFLALMLSAFYLSKNPATEVTITGQDHEVLYSIPVDLQKKAKPEIIPSAKPAGKDPVNQSNAGSSNLVVTDSLITASHTTASEGAQVNVSNDTSFAGATETGGAENGKSSNENTGGGNALLVKGNFEVDSQPEFEGGLAALYKFVASRLKYPGRAMDEGVQGTVFVKFVVDEKGKVGNLSLVNNMGYGLDDEALRVVAMIPNFKTPAKYNGEAVKVYFQLPIKFKYR